MQELALPAGPKTDRPSCVGLFPGRALKRVPASGRELGVRAAGVPGGYTAAVGAQLGGRVPRVTSVWGAGDEGLVPSPAGASMPAPGSWPGCPGSDPLCPSGPSPRLRPRRGSLCAALPAASGREVRRGGAPGSGNCHVCLNVGSSYQRGLRSGGSCCGPRLSCHRGVVMETRKTGCGCPGRPGPSWCLSSAACCPLLAKSEKAGGPCGDRPGPGWGLSLL